MRRAHSGLSMQLIVAAAVVMVTGCSKSTAIGACQQLEAKGITASCAPASAMSPGGVRTGASEEATFERGKELKGDGWMLASNGTVAVYPNDQLFEGVIASTTPPKESDPMSLYRFGNKRRRLTIHFAVLGTMPEEKRREIQAAVDAL